MAGLRYSGSLSRRILTHAAIFFASYRGLSRAFAVLLTRSQTGVCSLVRALQKHDTDSRCFALFQHTLFLTVLPQHGLMPRRKDFFRWLLGVTRPAGTKNGCCWFFGSTHALFFYFWQKSVKYIRRSTDFV